MYHSSKIAHIKIPSVSYSLNKRFLIDETDLMRFDKSSISGFQYLPQFISSQEENELIKNLQILNWEEVVLFGQVAKRQVAHFGYRYNYSNRFIEPTIVPPVFLKTLVSRTAAYLKVSVEKVAEILINKYPEGAGIGWHRDAPAFKVIVGISLGSATVLKLRNKDNKKEQREIFLAPGSAYILSDAVRWSWEHRIPPVKTLRYSITLRTLNSASQ